MWWRDHVTQTWSDQGTSPGTNWAGEAVSSLRTRIQTSELINDGGWNLQKQTLWFLTKWWWCCCCVVYYDRNEELSHQINNMFLHWGKHQHQILCQRKQMVIKFPFLYVLQQNTRMVHVHVMANHSGHDSMIEYVWSITEERSEKTQTWNCYRVCCYHAKSSDLEAHCWSGLQHEALHDLSAALQHPHLMGLNVRQSKDNVRATVDRS